MVVVGTVLLAGAAFAGEKAGSYNPMTADGKPMQPPAPKTN